MKLGLGTVQFGLEYGISAERDKVAQPMVEKILEYAAQKNIDVIDTAALYGSSEEALGNCLPSNHEFKIVTKTPFFSDVITQGDADALERVFLQSLTKLKQSSVYGLLIHRADDLLREGSELLWERMLQLKQQGLIKKIGASIYTAAQIDALLARYDFDLIQLPISVFDQRLLATGHLKTLKQRGVEIHARSVFLQGLLLKDPALLTGSLVSARQRLQHYHAVLRVFDVSPIQASMHFVLQQPDIDCVIVGVRSVQHLDELVVASYKSMNAAFDYAPFALQDEKILNPSQWNLR